MSCQDEEDEEDSGAGEPPSGSAALLCPGCDFSAAEEKAVADMKVNVGSIVLSAAA